MWPYNSYVGTRVTAIWSISQEVSKLHRTYATHTANPMKTSFSQPVAEALAAVNNATQFLFTVLLITIFIVAWLVQGGSIDMPEWTKDMRQLSEDDWTKYAAVLSSCVCVVFALFAAAGLALMRSESGHGYYSGR